MTKAKKDRPRCTYLLFNGDQCPKPCTWSQQVCLEHNNQAKGNGKRIMCRVCGEPQRDHPAGFPLDEVHSLVSLERSGRSWIQAVKG